MKLSEGGSSEGRKNSRGMENLEILKRAGKPTFLYEYYSKTGKGKAGWLDEKRLYDKYWYWKENLKKAKGKRKKVK